MSLSKDLDNIQLFKSILQQAPGAVAVIKGKEHVFEMVNPAYINLSGLCQSEILGRKVEDVFPELKEQGFCQLLDQVFETGESFSGSEMLITTGRIEDGNFREIYQDFIYQPYYNSVGSVEGIFYFGIDVTEQAVAKQKIRESEKKFREIVETAQEGIWLIDENSRTTFVNDTLCMMLEYSPEEMMGQDIYSFLEGKAAVEARIVIENKKKGRKSKHDVQLKTKSGRIIWISISANPIFNEQQQYKGGLAMITDITQRKKAEEALTQSEYNYKLLFNNAPLPHYICKRDTLEIIKVNAAAVRKYGYTESELLSMTSFDLRDTSHHAALRGTVEEVRNSGGQVQVVATHRKKTGEIMIVEVNAAMITYNGECCFLVNITDITKEVSFEKQLAEMKVEAQKKLTRAQVNGQEKERQFISTELHDNICQQIAATGLYLDMAASKEELRVELIDRSRKMLTNSIHEIRLFSRSLAPPALKTGDLGQAIAELISSYSVLQKFELHFMNAEWLKKLDDEMKLSFYRIIQEQVNNIAKYAEASNVWIRFSRNKDHICLVIRDDGKGFNKNIRPRGAGLGNIKNRIDLHNGTLEIITAPGKGCILDINVPFCPADTMEIREMVHKRPEDLCKVERKQR